MFDHLRETNIYQCSVIFVKSKRGQEAPIKEFRPPTFKRMLLVSLFVEEISFNSSLDCALGDIWQRILWAPLAFALIAQWELPRGVASNFGPSRLWLAITWFQLVLVGLQQLICLWMIKNKNVNFMFEKSCFCFSYENLSFKLGTYQTCF